jgi:hypothetical protein
MMGCCGRVRGKGLRGFIEGGMGITWTFWAAETETPSTERISITLNPSWINLLYIIIETPSWETVPVQKEV